MSICVYGELALDWLVSMDGDVKFRRGGAGLYAALCAAKSGITANILTVLGPEVDEYWLSVWNSIGISFQYAKKDENYSIPRYLTTGFSNHGKKISRPMMEIKNNYEYSPDLPKDSIALLMFPINHSIPKKICIQAKNRNIPIFLDPKPNENSISDAKKLLKYVDVLLVNEEEALLMSEKTKVCDAIEMLLDKGVKYIVVKRGIKGCIVAEKGKEQYIVPSYKSNAICTLGSGDAFGGALATIFVQTQDIKYSVKFASCMAACFIENYEIEYTPNKKAIEHYMEIRETLELGLNSHLTAYLAGPFFNQAELSWVNKIYRVLESSGISVLSPLNENGVINSNFCIDERKRIFHLDLKLLEKADIVIALIDHVDSGTSFEIGYAFSKGKPVIGLKTSEAQLNNMILCGCSKICTTLDELITEVYRYAKEQ